MVMLLRTTLRRMPYIGLYMFGQDEKGSFYPNIDQMWEIELRNKKSEYKLVDPVGSENSWYHRGNQYWTKSQPTYDGVLGGYGNLSSLDIKFSLGFILNYIQNHQEFNRGTALDCGAGIGRISKELLCQVFKTVDLVDQCQKLSQKSREILKEKNARNFYVKGLQVFQFEQKYDCVWIQWVFSYISEQDAVNFLTRAKAALNEGGVIILKQNHSAKGFLLDKQDCSVTRSHQIFAEMFKRAGLKIVKDEVQKNWPKELFGIRMYVLQ